MDCSTVEEARSLGIQTFDISGRGGAALPILKISGVGIVTTSMIGAIYSESLLALQLLRDEVELLAEWSVHPLDMIKPTCLKAKAVGLSRTMKQPLKNEPRLAVP